MCKSLGIWQQRKGDRKIALTFMRPMNATTKAAAGENNEYQEITLGIRDIVVTKHNKYSMDGLKDLAAGIEMDGLQEPLVLGQINGEYWLISGHRRMAALNILVAEGKKEPLRQSNADISR